MPMKLVPDGMPVTDEVDDACLWSDSTWCFRYELQSLLDADLSGDYEILLQGSGRWHEIVSCPF